jgi:glucuronate isomerase
MKPFISDDFLLGNDAARALYHEHAAAQPIIDFHNHLSPTQIAENHTFADLGEAWLAGDHYKWRAMRSNGVPERLVTGDAPRREKFAAWAATVPYTLRNPLYHWTHLELLRHFGIASRLGPETADAIWDESLAQLPQLRVRDIFRRFDVRAICTTDDPADPLDAHVAIRESGLTPRVYPTFRPDKALALEDSATFNAWLDRLAATAGVAIRTLDDLLEALHRRHGDFHAIGTRISDHGVETCPGTIGTRGEAARIFDAARSGQAVTAAEREAYAGFLMVEFGRWNAARGWTMQIHFGAQRNNNSRQRRALGPDTGYDSIGDFPHSRSLATLLDALDATDELPRTILYNLNPADNYLVGTMIGNFQDGTMVGKIQVGSGWWFLDQKEAMEWQMNALSNLGLLRRFVGMVTDSRSFLSFPRHEYFRRVLCNLLGRDMESGELPDDPALIGAMVREISFENARDFLGLELG